MIDIIIPVYQDRIPKRFYECLQKLFANTSDFNLMLVTSSSPQPQNINEGLRRAKAPFIAILDWDVLVPARWLKILLKNLQNQDLTHSSPIGIIGPKMVGDYVGMNRNALLGVQDWPTLAGGCLVFRNLDLRWDEQFPSGYWADTDFCRQFRARGYRVAINGDVEVAHYPDTFTSNPEQVQKWSDIGAEIYKKKWGDNEF